MPTKDVGTYAPPHDETSSEIVFLTLGLSVVEPLRAPTSPANLDSFEAPPCPHFFDIDQCGSEE
jgi:hypothetical protein